MFTFVFALTQPKFIIGHAKRTKFPSPKILKIPQFLRGIQKAVSEVFSVVML